MQHKWYPTGEFMIGSIRNRAVYIYLCAIWLILGLISAGSGACLLFIASHVESYRRNPILGVAIILIAFGILRITNCIYCLGKVLKSTK